MRRSRRRSALGLGLLTEASGSRGNLWWAASHFVKPLIAVRYAWTVRVDRPWSFNNPAY